MIDKKMPLSALAGQMKVYPQVLVNVRVKDKARARADKDVVQAIALAEERLGDTGRILVRESGTEPVVRVMAEAETNELCAELVQSIVDVIEKNGHKEE